MYFCCSVFLLLCRSFYCCHPCFCLLLPSLMPVWRIRDVYPGTWFLPSDPGSKKSTKERGEKKLVAIPFYLATNFTIVNYFSFEVLKKKIWANFQGIIELFIKKIVKALKNMVLGSGIRKKPIPDPGSRIQGSKRHRIPDPGSGSATLSLLLLLASLLLRFYPRCCWHCCYFWRAFSSWYSHCCWSPCSCWCSGGVGVNAVACVPAVYGLSAVAGVFTVASARVDPGVLI